MKTSYEKSKINVLLLENIDKNAVQNFSTDGYHVETHSASLTENELAEKIENVHILGIRSKTLITQKVLEQAKKLWSIGAFCIGTNAIDLPACLEKGITVFNAPYSNTRSVVELTLAEIIILLRGVFQRSTDLHKGLWQKTAKGNFEVRGKKLGIVGYGNIGSQLSILAENIGMEVYFYDKAEKLALGNAKACRSLQELLNIADVVSLHVDGTSKNRDLIGAEEFSQMRDGAIFLNLSRGFVVNIPSLVKALKSGKIRGAGVDVFPDEPNGNGDPFTSELQNLPNVILTPHIGGSTEEAQVNIGNFVSNKIINYMNSGDTSMSVNFPSIQLPTFENTHRLLHIHHNRPGVMASINDIFKNHQINIAGQYLKTNEQIGYVITDVDTNYNPALIEEFKSVDQTIRFRVLY